jgi:hypothetical protein
MMTALAYSTAKNQRPDPDRSTRIGQAGITTLELNTYHYGSKTGR